MADDVFDAADQGGETEGKTDDNPVNALVGEDKKFKTVEDLAKSKLEADAFIEQLKEENKVALEELKKYQGQEDNSAKVQELLEAVKAAGQQQDSEGDNQLTDEALSEKIREIMQGVSAEETAKRNRAKGNELVLRKVGGDVEAAKLFVAERAKELGLKPSALAELSEISPQAFAKLIDANTSASSSGSTNLQHSNPRAMESHATIETVDGHHTKAYYDRVRKEMGTVKYLQDRKLQKRYLDDAMALGDRFNTN